MQQVQPMPNVTVKVHIFVSTGRAARWPQHSDFASGGNASRARACVTLWPLLGSEKGMPTIPGRISYWVMNRLAFAHSWSEEFCTPCCFTW